MEKHITIKELNLNFWTKNLIGLLPLETDSLVFSGPLLLKIYLYAVNQMELPKPPDTLEFLDLYLIGSKEKQFEKIFAVLDSLSSINDKIVVCKPNKPTPLYIIFNGIPIVIRIHQTEYLSTKDLLENFCFAHQCMYYTINNFFIEPHAKLSIEQNQVYSNFIVKARAKLSDLLVAKSVGINIDAYIREFPMIATLNDKPDIHEKIWKEFYSQTNNITTTKFINFVGMKIAEPKIHLSTNLTCLESQQEMFLTEKKLEIIWEND